MSRDFELEPELDRLFQQVHELCMEGRFPDAIEIATRARDLARRTYGEGHPDYAASLNCLANSYHGVGDYVSALPLLHLAIEVYRNTLGESHSDYAGSLNNLAEMYREMGDYASAEPLHREALRIRRAALGEAHPDYASGLKNLGVLYMRMGDYASAEPLFRQAVEIRRAALGEGQPDYAAALNNLAVLYSDKGDYAAAEPLCRQAIEIERATLGQAHPGFAASLNNLAALFMRIGDYAAAEPLYRQAMEVWRSSVGEGHPDYATSLNNLAELYEAMLDYASAEPLMREALAVTRAALGEAHPDYAIRLDSLAKLYHIMGAYASAERLFRQAMEIRRAAQGEARPDYAISLHNLAIFYSETGDYTSAEPLCRQALEIRRTALGEGHPDYCESLEALALLSVALDRESDALALMQKAAAIDDRLIGQVFSVGSEEQRAVFLAKLQRRTSVFLSLVLNQLDQSQEAVRAALDLPLRRKALRAEGQAAQRDAVLGGRYLHLQPKLRELKALRARIVQKTLAGPGPEGAPTHQRQLAECAGRRDDLERELARQIPEVNLEQKLRASDHRAVALNLPEGVALVEFVSFPAFDFQAVPARGEPLWKPLRYVAFVLSAGATDDVQMIDLGEAEPIDRLIADFRAGIIPWAETPHDRDMTKRKEQAAPTVESGAGLALRAALFDKLAPALDARERLLISPDGDLARLPFEVLPAAAGRRLIDDYQISYLSCGRDLLRFGAAATRQPDEPLVVADPDFDLEAMSPTGPVPARPEFWSRLLGRGKNVIKTPRPSVPTPDTTARSAGRHSRELDRDRSAYHFHRLPGTRAEGERVATRLGVSPWLDASALEGRLKTACHSPRILHLATHGFFLPDQPSDSTRERPGLMGDLGRESGRFMGPLPESPMLRSGLALTGANTWLKGGRPPESAEDGLLTAEDVSGLDLLSTELVVLSACETGLGQIHIGEGVFGLRRAFVLAGAKTLVMSLWKVPDEPTRELMENFYRRVLAGEARAEALRQAQLALRAEYPAPYYWGAFICQGDPSPLGTAGRESRVQALPMTD